MWEVVVGVGGREHILCVAFGLVNVCERDCCRS